MILPGEGMRVYLHFYKNAYLSRKKNEATKVDAHNKQKHRNTSIFLFGKWTKGRVLRLGN